MAAKASFIPELLIETDALERQLDRRCASSTARPTSFWIRPPIRQYRFRLADLMQTPELPPPRPLSPARRCWTPSAPTVLPAIRRKSGPPRGPGKNSGPPSETAADFFGKTARFAVWSEALK
jgi:hypothetical protein